MDDIWYMIPGFNGYEINKSGQVRSMKMMYADPGHIMKQNKYGYYTLSNNENKRIRISYDELYDITFNSGEKMYTRIDKEVYMGSRNKFVKREPIRDDTPTSLNFSNCIEEVLIRPIYYDL